MDRTILVAAAFALCLPASARAQGTSASIQFRCDPGHLRRWYVSLPYAAQFPDVANTMSVRGDKCLPPEGPDGIINSDDVICALFVNGDFARRDGTFCVMQYDTSRCVWISRQVSKVLGDYRFTGEAFALDPCEGMQVLTGLSSLRPALAWTTTLLDYCEPRFGGRQLDVGACGATGLTPNMLHVPYDIAYRTADELLCGHAGIDWYDVDGDGDPDVCPSGLYDEAAGGAVTLSWFDTNTDVQYSRTAVTVLGRLRFTGVNFTVPPGGSVIAQVARQPVAAWVPPVTTCATAPTGGPCPGDAGEQ